MTRNERIVSALGIPLVLGIPWSEMRAQSHARELRATASPVPNRATGQLIEIPPAKGLPAAYITQREWETVAPYWDTTFVFIGLLLLLLLGFFLNEAYTGFMRGWRSNK